MEDEISGLILAAQPSTALTVAVYLLSVHGWTVLHKILGWLPMEMKLRVAVCVGASVFLLGEKPACTQKPVPAAFYGGAVVSKM